MGHPFDRTVQDILVSNERGCKVTISHWITVVDFPNLMGGCNLVWEFEGRDILII